MVTLRQYLENHAGKVVEFGQQSRLLLVEDFLANIEKQNHNVLGQIQTPVGTIQFESADLDRDVVKVDDQVYLRREDFGTLIQLSLQFKDVGEVT